MAAIQQCSWTCEICNSSGHSESKDSMPGGWAHAVLQLNPGNKDIELKQGRFVADVCQACLGGGAKNWYRERRAKNVLAWFIGGCL